jgi:hypothetical protein
MQELMAQMNAQLAELPQWVQYWIDWMSVIFILPVLFVWKNNAARYVLATFVVTLSLAMFVFYLTRDVHLLGITHVIFWTPLFYGLYRYELKDRGLNFRPI